MTIHFPISYHPPEHHHGHWSITDSAGRELACPHTPPTPELVELILGLNPQPEPAPLPAHKPRPTPPSVAPCPSPAMMPPLDTDDAANALFALTPTPAAWEWMKRNDVSTDRLREIIQDPATEVSPAPGHPDRSIYRGGGYRIVVAPADKAVLGIYPTTWLSNGAYEKQRHTGTKHDHRLPVPHTPTDMLKRLQSRGFTADNHRGHYEVRHPQHPAKRLTMPSTPSDNRWAENFVASVRSTFDVDLRAPDSTP